MENQFARLGECGGRQILLTVEEDDGIWMVVCRRDNDISVSVTFTPEDGNTYEHALDRMNAMDIDELAHIMDDMIAEIMGADDEEG